VRADGALRACAAAAAPSGDDASAHLAACEEVSAALEERGGLAECGATFAAELAELRDRADEAGVPLTPSQELAARILYLRRVHRYDYFTGAQHASHSSMLAACGEAHLSPAVAVHAAGGRQPTVSAFRWDDALRASRAHAAYVRELCAADAAAAAESSEAVEALIQANTVEEEPGKYRVPLSGKLFREPIFVRKHIENKHPEAIAKAKTPAFEDKYRAYHSAWVRRAAAMPPPPPRPPRDSGGRGRHDDEGGMGKGGGRGGRGYGRGGGRFGGGPMLPPEGGVLPPPPEGAAPEKRRLVQYRDLDAPDDDDLFS